MSGSNGSFYRVVMSESLRHKLKQWREYARQNGLSEPLLRDYRLLHQALVQRPLSGEPAYRLHQMDVMVYRLSFDLLVVYYAVDESRHIVYVKDFMATRNLEQPEVD